MFSLRGIVAFFCIFGWLGLTMVTNGTEEWLAVLIAFIGGFLAMLGVAFLLKVLSKLQSDGTMDIRYAIGASGSVYISVPPQRSAKGKVNLLIQGKWRNWTPSPMRKRRALRDRGRRDRHLGRQYADCAAEINMSKQNNVRRKR